MPRLWRHACRIIEANSSQRIPIALLLCPTSPPKQMPENIPKLGAWWLLVDQDREGIESHLNLEESKDIYENSQKATLQSNPQEEWLLVNVLGHSAPTKPCADLPHGPKARHPLDELNCSRPFRGPTVY